METIAEAVRVLEAAGYEANKNPAGSGYTRLIHASGAWAEVNPLGSTTKGSANSHWTFVAVVPPRSGTPSFCEKLAATSAAELTAAAILAARAAAPKRP